MRTLLFLLFSVLCLFASCCYRTSARQKLANNLMHDFRDDLPDLKGDGLHVLPLFCVRGNGFCSGHVF